MNAHAEPVRTSCAALAAVLSAALACGDGGGSELPRSHGASVLSCLVSDRPADPAEPFPGVPGAIRVENGWIAVITGHAVDPAGPPPSPCSFTPTRTFALVDADGYRWWVGLAVVLPATSPDAAGEDVTPAADAARGEVTLTIRVADTWARDQSFSLSDGGGLLLAANLGALLLEPEDAGGLAMAAGDELPTVYRDECGRFRERSVVFTGDATLDLAPGRPGIVQLGGIPIGAWNVRSVGWVGAVQCTDLSDWVVTLAWRPAPS